MAAETSLGGASAAFEVATGDATGPVGVDEGRDSAFGTPAARSIGAAWGAEGGAQGKARLSPPGVGPW